MMRKVHIVSVAARTPLGLTAEESAAAVRAGISHVREHPFLVDGSGEPLRAATDSVLDPQLAGSLRLFELARSALESLTNALAMAGALPPSVGLLLGVPEIRPGFAKIDEEQLVQSLAQCNSPGLDSLQVFAVGAGHAGALHALEVGSKQIISGQTEMVLVGGVDSYMSLRTLQWLEECRQLANEYTRGGFIPGEAAGFLALASREACERHNLRSLAQVRGFHSGFESHLIKTNSDVLGDGLSESVLGATRDLQSSDERVDEIYCDINGERYRSDEWGFAALRTQSALRDATIYTAPADCWGDVGAASGALFCMLAAQAWKRDYASGPLSLAWCSSERGLRSSVLLQRSIYRQEQT